MRKNKPKVNAPLGATLVVLSSFFYASYGIWTKLMGNFFEGYTASALRSILVLLVLIPIAVTYRKLEPIRLKRTWTHYFGMFLGSLVVWGPLYYAIIHADIGISLILHYASYLIGMFVFGWLFARERFTRDGWLSALLGLIGLGLVFSPSTASFGWLALGAATLSGVGAAIVTFASKQIPYKATQATLAIWSMSTIANVLVALVISETRPAIGWHVQYLYLLVFAIASVIASWSLTKGVKLIDAGAAGILGLLEIVFGVLFGVIFFHERPDVVALIGMAIIIAAATIPYIKDYNTKRGTLDQT